MDPPSSCSFEAVVQDTLGLSVYGSSPVVRTAVVAGSNTLSVLPQLPVIACSLFVPYRSLSRERVLFISDFSAVLDPNGNTFWFNKRNV